MTTTHRSAVATSLGAVMLIGGCDVGTVRFDEPPMTGADQQNVLSLEGEWNAKVYNGTFDTVTSVGHLVAKRLPEGSFLLSYRGTGLSARDVVSAVAISGKLGDDVFVYLDGTLTVDQEDHQIASYPIETIALVTASQDRTRLRVELLTFDLNALERALVEDGIGHKREDQTIRVMASPRKTLTCLRKHKLSLFGGTPNSAFVLEKIDDGSEKMKTPKTHS